MKKLIALLIRFVPRKYLQRVSGVGLRVLGMLYAGNNVICPICNTHFSKFLPYGRINPRPNALCPKCQALERHRLIWLYLQERTQFFNRKMDVLHIAPEACFMRPFESMHGSANITADIESPLAKVKMDIHRIPFKDNSFDAVLCNHVLEHVQDDIKAMSEICRVLRPGGFAVLQVPFFNPLPDKTYEDFSITDARAREKAFGQDDHVRKYGRDYAERMSRAGLKAVADNFVNEKSEAERKRFGLVKGETLFIGFKP